jgi:hypothetical protein
LLQDDTGDMSSFAVLKSEFNLVLNYFKAKELGDTIITSWRDSMEAWSRGDCPEIYLEDWENVGKHWYLSDLRLSEGLSEDVTTLKGATDPAGSTEQLRLPDVTKLNSLMRVRWLVSRKKTLNMFDLANRWKRDVLTSMNEDLLDDLSDSRPRLLPPNTSDEYLELVSGDWEDAVYPIDEIRPAVKRKALEPMSGSSKRLRKVDNSLARATSTWGQQGVSDVQIGPSAPRGLITHYLSKRDSKGKRKAN